MKKYNVLFSSKAKKELKKMEQKDALLLVAWIKKNLIETSNPRRQGKALSGELSDYWCYRVGSYRLIAEIFDDALTIHLINIGNRKDIYKK